ncbi:MAG: presqualene diphosphate synthase HpnD, partial [Candidatus Binatia bacterium]
LLTLPEAYAYCRRITRKSSSNFYHAFHLLPLEQQNGLCALYAFCRFLDDITDQPGASSQRQNGNRTEYLATLLDTWREELRHCYTGTPRHPIAQALADTVRRFSIRQEHLAGIIDGVEMDLSRTRYQTFTELYDYCYHVASLVGLVCIEIFGYRNAGARDYAVNLGVALQLTNILRDVGEDAQRGRIYLPSEDLARFGYSEQGLSAGVYNDAFVQLMTFEGKRASEYYRRAVAYLAPEDRRTLAAAEAMRLIYQRLFDKLVACHFNVLGTRVTLPTSYKIGLALAAWARGRLVF